MNMLNIKFPPASITNSVLGSNNLNILSSDNQNFRSFANMPDQASLVACIIQHTWLDNKVRELIAVKVLHTSLLNITVLAFIVLPLGSYAPMPAASPPFKTILELVLWDGLQSCRCITPDDINVINMPSFQYFLYLRRKKKFIGR